MGKIKILRIITRMNIGGPARQAALLSSELAKKEFDCVLLTGSPSKNEGDMGYIASENGIKPLVIPAIGREINLFNDLYAFLKIYNIIQKERPMIVHTHTAKAGSIGRLAAKMAGVPVIIHTFHGHVFHGYFSAAKTRFFLAIEKLLAGVTDRIIAVSEGQKEEIKRYLSIKDSGKIIAIPLGFDLDKFTAERDESALRIELGIPKEVLVLGIVGRLTAIKNHNMFFLAAKEIKSLNPDKRIKFVIVGDGELKGDLVRLARSLGIYSDCIFTSWRKDIDALYRIMDVVSLTSLNEGTPVSIIEALASARPVVVTDVGGVRDEVEDGKSGFIVPSNDIEAFARAVTSLINDKDKRERFGKYGREFACKRHSKEQLISSIENLYYSELKKKEIK
ncbi:MAG: glycosyltransferase family 4 protein [Candidatus Omnitrophica bacterium]|nr:glycosyltransferase family 4 protein [Candidatus Omnitrophota bacterium]